MRQGTVLGVQLLLRSQLLGGHSEGGHRLPLLRLQGVEFRRALGRRQVGQAGLGVVQPALRLAADSFSFSCSRT